MAVAGQAAQRGCLGQYGEVMPVEAGAGGKVLDGGKRPFPAGLFDALCARCPHALDHAQAEPQRLRAAEDFQCAVPVAVAHISRQHLDAVALCILDQLCGLVKAHRLRVEQSAGKGSRVMALQPGGDVHQQRKTGCVGLREAVFAETADLLKYLLGESFAVAALQHAADQSLVHVLHATAARPGSHRAA